MVRISCLQETWVRSLGQENPPKKGMATHSSSFAWRIPWAEETGRLWSMGLQRVGHNRTKKKFHTHTHTHTHTYIHRVLFTYPVNLCLLFEVFNSFIFQAIINIYVHIAFLLSV